MMKKGEMNQEMQQIKEIIFSKTDSEIGFIVNIYNDQYLNIYKEKEYIGTRKEMILSNKYGSPYTKEKYQENSSGMIYTYNVFKEANEKMSLEKRNAIIKETKLRKSLKEDLNINFQKYNEIGIIIIGENEIKITQGELIENNLKPESFGWVSLEEYNKGERRVPKKVEIIEKDISDLLLVTQLVDMTKENLDNTNLKYFIKYEKELDDIISSRLLENVDEYDKILIIEKIKDFKLKIEEKIKLISLINLEDINVAIENVYKKMQLEYSDLDLKEIKEYSSETEKSITELLNEIKELQKEYTISSIINNLQNINEKCKNILKPYDLDNDVFEENVVQEKILYETPKEDINIFTEEHFEEEKIETFNNTNLPVCINGKKNIFIKLIRYFKNVFQINKN